MTRYAQIPVPVVHVSVRGRLPGVGGYARRKIARSLGHAPEPVLDARIRLVRHGDPARPEPITARASLDVNGHPVHARVRAATAREAVDELARRLRTVLARSARNWPAIRGHAPDPRSRGRRRGADHRIPEPEDRQVIRRRNLAPPVESTDDAVFAMNSMGHDFHLFTESGSHVDSVVYRGGPTGYRLARVSSGDRSLPDATAQPVTISARPAPQLTIAAAIDRLDLTEARFVFFRDRTSRRGNVLYRRDDGHLGLLIPADQAREGRS